MNRSVTLTDIARKCGVHYSTVSLALRDDPRISASTRALVHRAAEALGYRPDPMLKALSIYRQAVKPKHYHATLAWLSDRAQPQIHRPDYIFRKYVLGAMERAEDLGYRIEEFALRAPGMTGERLQAILHARGIDGILVSPLPGPRTYGRIKLDWAAFHAVSFGYSLAWPPLHRVAPHHSGGARLAVRKLYSLGYRRIGIVLCEVGSGRNDGNWLGGYLAQMMARNLEPLVFLRQSSNERVLLSPADSPKLKAWIKRYKLEALIFDYSPPFVDWLRVSCGLRVPEDIGVASLNVPAGDEVHSGVDQRDHEIGWYALDTLVNMINTHEKGIPNVPHKLLLEGSWRAGKTTRRVASKQAR